MPVFQAIKIMAGRRQALADKMWFVDIRNNVREGLNLPPRDPDCPCCGRHRFDYLEDVTASPVVPGA